MKILIPALALFALAGVVQAQPAQEGSSLSAALSRCRALASPDEKAACYDAALDTAGSRGEDAPAGAAPAPSPPRAAAAGVVRVEAMRLRRDGALVFVTPDDAVWVQSDNQRLSYIPGPGDSIRIRRAAMGSYKCEVSRWQAVRCRQVR